MSSSATSEPRRSARRFPRVPCRAFAAALVSLAVGILAAPAGAQDLEAPVEVFELPRPDYDPRGIPAGGLRIFPSLTLAETFDDNIFAAEDEAEADFVTTMRGAVQVESDWSRHGLGLGAYAEDGRYLLNGDQSRQQYGVRPSFLLEITQAQRVAGSGEYRREVLSRSDPEDLDDRDPTELDRFIAELEYVGSYNRVSLGALGRVDRRDFLSARDDDRDRIELRIGPRVGYLIGPKLEVFLSPFVLERDFDRLGDDGLERDARLTGAIAGLRTEFTSLVHLDFGLGAAYNDYEDPAFDDSLNLVIEGAADWYVTPISTLKASVSRRDVATDQPGSSSRTESRVEAELQHELLHNLLLGLRLGFIHDDFRETARQDERAEVEVLARYLIDRAFSLGASYRYEQRWSNAAGEDFLRNRFTLGLRARF